MADCRPPSQPDEGLEISVEVVFCPDRSSVDSSRLSMPAGSTVAQALQASGVLVRFPTLVAQAAGAADVGIWGRLATLQQALRDGDRVELYRPLQVDPKEARRLRQRHQARRKAEPGRPAASGS